MIAQSAANIDTVSGTIGAASPVLGDLLLAGFLAGSVVAGFVSVTKLA